MSMRFSIMSCKVPYYRSPCPCPRCFVFFGLFSFHRMTRHKKAHCNITNKAYCNSVPFLSQYSAIYNLQKQSKSNKLPIIKAARNVTYNYLSRYVGRNHVNICNWLLLVSLNYKLYLFHPHPDPPPFIFSATRQN